VTAEQKQSLAGFLDIAGDYLGGGYVRPRPAAAFTGDGPEMPGGGTGAGVLSPALGDDTLENIAAGIRGCRLCPLASGRANAVPGEGVEHPLVLVVGEGPGQDEDRTGRPFVGRAGQLLDKMLAAIGLSRRENCFIANVVKCRPPENRDPTPPEIRSCVPFLNRQISCLRPRIILCLGKVAANLLLRNLEQAAIGSLRGRLFEYALTPLEAGTPGAGGAGAGGAAGEPEQGFGPIPLVATYHPSALLRNEDLKRPAWEDLKLLRAKLEELRGT
jgi:DNA polymerase